MADELAESARGAQQSTIRLLVAAALLAVVLDAVNSSLWTWLGTDDLFNSGQRQAYIVASSWRHVALIAPAMLIAVVAVVLLRLPGWFPGAIAGFMLLGDPPFRLSFLINVEAYWPSTILVLVLATLWELRRRSLADHAVLPPGTSPILLRVGTGALLFTLAINSVYDFLADMEQVDPAPILRLTAYALVPAVFALLICLLLSRSSFRVDGFWIVIAVFSLTAAIASVAPGPMSFTPDFRAAWPVEVAGGVVAVVAAWAGEFIGRRSMRARQHLTSAST